MSDNSLYLRTNSTNFSSIFKDDSGQHSLQTNACSIVEETEDLLMSEVITVQDFHYDWLEVGGRVGCRPLNEQLT